MSEKGWRHIKIGWPSIGEWPLFYLLWDWPAGVIWWRVFGYGLTLKAPWWPPLFSERYGHKKPLVRVGGWRLFPLCPSPTAPHTER